ncbi:MAG: short chain dehydrogenase family protein [Capsulimonas sp.]|jgi:NAD(P)-dependent dehydrogenase (short-subunit alcohol dehydrogenase family)|nr:short chain dehydrogenase family protein [Capsulimonas sp.]
MTNLQKPVGSKFGAASTAAEVIEGIDLSGKTAIVTGGYSGLGLETARALRSAGAQVIVPARDLNKAAAALAGIEGVQIEPMDLIDPASINAFAQRFLASGQPLHILVNSAGIMAGPLARDARGYEAQFATNHLGHFQLVRQLWPALLQANGARVVSVSSWGHRRSPVIFEDPNFERREYEGWAAYGQSKTANILFALELDKRGKSDGVRAFSLHPGSIVGTGLQKHVSHEELRAFGVIDENGNQILDPARQMKTVEQGAATSVWCAVSAQLDGMGGVYCENCEVAELYDDKSPQSFGVMPYAVDPEAAERLWTLSEQLTL